MKFFKSLRNSSPKNPRNFIGSTGNVVSDCIYTWRIPMWLEFQLQIEGPKPHILSRVDCSLREWRDIQAILGEQHQHTPILSPLPPSHCPGLSLTTPLNLHPHKKLVVSPDLSTQGLRVRGRFFFSQLQPAPRFLASDGSEVNELKSFSHRQLVPNYQIPEISEIQMSRPAVQRWR